MTTKAKQRDRLKRAAAKNRKGKRSGTLPEMAANAEDCEIYLGNSAQVDAAREAWERADAWAQAPAGTKYGAKR